VKREEIFLSGGKKVPNRFALVRDTDQSIFATCGRVYRPFQNKSCFKFFDGIIEQGAAIYHTAGSILGGRKIWVLAKLPEEFTVHGEDLIEEYILLSNSHDGTSPIVACITPTRVVCQNTLNFALAEAVNRVSIRHTINAEHALQEAHKVMGIAHKQFAEANKYFNQLAVSNINVSQFTSYLDMVFPTVAENTTKTDAIKARVTSLFEGDAKGSDLPGFKGTLWGAYNSVVEFVDYKPGHKNRLDAVWFGNGAKKKSQAFESAVAMATA